MNTMKKLAASLCLFALLIPGLALGQAVTTQSPTSLTQQAIQALIAQDQSLVATANTSALAQFNLGCSNWTATNIQNRALKLPLTAKPSQPTAIHFTATVAPDGLSASTAFTVGPDVLGQACADLPSATLPANNVQVGQPLGGLWYAVGLQDTVPVGQAVQYKDHTYFKIAASIGGGNPNSDGSVPGWYYQIQ